MEVFRPEHFCYIQAEDEGNKDGCSNPAKIHLFKVNYGNTRKRCEICPKLKIKSPGRES